MIINKEFENRCVKGVHARDEAALKKMFDAYYQSLCSVAADFVGSYDIGKEVVQEVLLNIWERGSDWNPAGSLKVYLYHAVCKKSMNYIKQDNRRRNAINRYGLETEIQSEWNESSIEEQEMIRKVWETAQKMPEKRYLVFILHKRHGLSYKDVAQTMGISVKTVENQMGQALRFLRSELCAEESYS